MAPEQFAGGAADSRVDYYALACLAYEALSGRRAIESSDVLAIVQQKLQFVLPPRSEIGSGVTTEMHEFLSRGLEVPREAKYQTRPTGPVG